MMMYYKFVVYPDGHGSAHLLDDKGNELGLVALFPDKATMNEVEQEIRDFGNEYDFIYV